MLETLQIRNFKSIADSGVLKFSKLNILVGANNVGKSSLLQAILLIKQSSESRNLDSPLVTAGPLGDFGSYLDFIRNHDRSSRLSLSFSFSKNPKTDSSLIDELHEFNNYRFEFGFDFAANQIHVHSADYHAPQHELHIRRKEGKMHLADTTVPELKDAQVRMVSLHPQITPKTFPRPDAPAFRYMLIPHFDAQRLQQRMERVKHIAPVREAISRYGFIGGMPSEQMGPSGQNLMRVLSSSKGEALVKRLNHWLGDQFQLLRKIRLVNINREKTVKALIGREFSGKTDVNLSMMGSGISQVVPVIVQALLLPKDGTLIVEQPDLHLHPRAQAHLADLFIEIANQDRQLFIETHSEHLLLRLRRRIAETKIDPKNVSLLFFEKQGESTIVRQISVDAQGNLDEWPKDFFAEGYIEAMALARAASQESGDQ